MRIGSSAITVVALAALTASCGGYRAEQAFSRASSTQPGGPAYNQALYDQCMQYADFEFNEMQDWQSTQFHSANAISGATQGTVEPEPINTPDLQPRNLPEDKVAELTAARQRYLNAVSENKQDEFPQEMAAAVCSYNCWIEQQAENRQPLDIAACRGTFMSAMETIEGQPEVIVAETIVLSSDVLFDFDRSNIKPEFEAELNEIAQLLVENSNERALVWGFTDSVGTEEYNQGLSERRAQSVADYLEGQGVTTDRMVVQGFGETRPVASNDTAEGRALNRRVEIRKR